MKRLTEIDLFRNLHVVSCMQEVIQMEITTEEYRVLFNSITNAIYTLESLRTDLINAQRVSEEIVICRTSIDMPKSNWEGLYATMWLEDCMVALFLNAHKSWQLSKRPVFTVAFENGKITARSIEKEGWSNDYHIQQACPRSHSRDHSVIREKVLNRDPFLWRVSEAGG